MAFVFKIFFRCAHSKCNKKCFVPCDLCQESCKTACEHTKCSKKCHELCNVLQYDQNPCNEPCAKKIKKCGHPCIGICGERCPLKCRICDKDEVTEIIFGAEDEPTAKFVHLTDCNHIVELNAMDKWIASTFEFSEANSKCSVQLPKCPRCKTTIRQSMRYSNCIKRQLKAIEDIKKKQYGNSKENQKNRLELLQEIKKNLGKDVFSAKSLYKSFVEDMAFQIETNKLSFNELAGFKNNWTIFLKLNKILTDAKFNALKSSQANHVELESNKLLDYVYSQKYHEVFLVEYQQRNELIMELERLECLVKYYDYVNKAQQKTIYDLNASKEVGSLLFECENDLISNIRKFNDATKFRVNAVFQRLVKLLKVELTPAEKIMIVKAMGLQKGHWFKCPNGHMYCIDQCGGAMELAKCPECKENIGGTQHRLVTGNSLASDMDGAKYPAWSETANNMANWNI